MARAVVLASAFRQSHFFALLGVQRLTWKPRVCHTVARIMTSVLNQIELDEAFFL